MYRSPGSISDFTKQLQAVPLPGAAARGEEYLMAFRDEERRRAIAAAQKEPLNRNGYRRDQSPLSRRTAAEVSQTMAAPDPESAPPDHAPSATTRHVVYSGNVRERLERAAAKRREEQSAPVTQSAARHLAYAEAYRAIHGEYPRHGI
jgi:DNA-directed RNA polymerase specialized sigma24 family protein